jgi:hypothetical protein
MTGSSALAWSTAVLASIVTMVCCAAEAAPLATVAVPFVGCPADGQDGPRRAPVRGRRPALPASAAARLAYYGADVDGIGTLAPRGWRCAVRYGSDGTVMAVAPDAASLSRVLNHGDASGPAVVRRISYAGTSGRFEVARVAAALFPSLGVFVSSVASEHLEGPFRRGLPAGDRATRRGPRETLFTTPSGVRGFGTSSGLGVGPLPVDGIAVVAAGEEPDADVTYARLPSGLRPLVSFLISDADARAVRARG